MAFKLFSYYVLFTISISFCHSQEDKEIETPRFLKATNCQVETEEFVRNITDEIERTLAPVEDRGYQRKDIDELEEIMQDYFEILVAVVNDMDAQIDSFIQMNNASLEFDDSTESKYLYDYDDDDYLSVEDDDEDEKTDDMP